MATWPSGSKASTTNLDAGTDKPSLARADIKQAIDNQNQIIDMFNISSPTNNQILKYNTTNTRFELAAEPTSGITDVVQDTTPQLGGNLDVQSYKITTSTNNTLTIEGKTDYNVEILAMGTGDIRLNPAVNGDVVLDGQSWPRSDGTNGQVLTTDGAGQLSWTTPSAGGSTISSVVFQFSSPALVSGSTYKATVTELLDTGSVASVSNTYDFTLNAGTYLIIWNSTGFEATGINGAKNSNFAFTTVSGDASITGLGDYLSALNTASADTAFFASTKNYFTLTQTSTYYLSWNQVVSNLYPTMLTLLKIA